MVGLEATIGLPFCSKDAATPYGKTALMCAAEEGHLEVVCFLLEAGADKEAPTTKGCRALTIAAWYGHLEVVRLLLEARADKDATTRDGQTASSVAAANGHLEVVRLLGVICESIWPASTRSAGNTGNTEILGD